MIKVNIWMTSCALSIRNWSIHWTQLLFVWHMFQKYFLFFQGIDVITYHIRKSMSLFKAFYKSLLLGIFSSYIIVEVLFFGILVLILELFNVDFFWVDLISISWTQYLYSGGIKNCLWGVYRSDLRILIPTGLWKVNVRVRFFFTYSHQFFEFL